jgi:hypothetical protein
MVKRYEQLLASGDLKICSARVAARWSTTAPGVQAAHDAYRTLSIVTKSRVPLVAWRSSGLPSPIHISASDCDARCRDMQ